MKRVTAYRANKVLYNFLMTNSIRGKVLLPSNICHDVAEVLQYAGMSLHYVDIESNTLCADRDKVLSLVKGVSLLLYVHTYGCDVPTNDFFIKVKSVNPNIAIVDDRCLCVPELNVIDNNADLILFSTGEKKQVELKQGGIGYVADKWEYEEVPVPVDCECLDNLDWYLNQPELLSRQESVILHKKVINKIYQTLLPIEIQLPDNYNGWRFNIRVTREQRGKILDALFIEGLFASGHYKSLGDNCPIAEKLSAEVVNLFNDFYYSEEQAVRTCHIINQVLML